MLIQRELYLQRLIARRHNGMVKVITGIRRSGKSFLLFEIFKQYLLDQGIASDHILGLQLDRFENRRYRDPEELMTYLNERIIDDRMYYILLDEVQMLDHFSEVLNSFLYRKNIDLYVTGSNSKFLSTDVLTEFRGRGDEVHIFPLSFSEFMQVCNEDISEAWRQYATYGGLPQVVLMQEEEQKSAFLKRLFEQTYLRDIIERNGILKSQELEDVVNIVASSIGSLTNPTKISDTFKSKLKSTISPNTVRTYINHLKEAFLISEAQRFDVKGRKYIGSPTKLYFEDVGLRNARLNFRQMEETHLMENIIYNELRLRGFSVDVGSVNKRQVVDGRSLSYQLEVDFVANLGSRRYYIQSALSLPDQQKRDQEKASLLAIKDAFRKIIIVKNGLEQGYDEDGIFYINLKKFLNWDVEQVKLLFV